MKSLGVVVCALTCIVFGCRAASLAIALVVAMLPAAIDAEIRMVLAVFDAVVVAISAIGLFFHSAVRSMTGVRSVSFAIYVCLCSLIGVCLATADGITGMCVLWHLFPPIIDIAYLPVLVEDGRAATRGVV